MATAKTLKVWAASKTKEAEQKNTAASHSAAAAAHRDASKVASTPAEKKSHSDMAKQHGRAAYTHTKGQAPTATKAPITFVGEPPMRTKPKEAKEHASRADEIKRDDAGRFA